jgi:hypothetical protein
MGELALWLLGVVGRALTSIRGCLPLQRLGCRARLLAVLRAPPVRRGAPGSSRRAPRAAAGILGDLDRAPHAPPLGVAA